MGSSVMNRGQTISIRFRRVVLAKPIGLFAFFVLYTIGGYCQTNPSAVVEGWYIPPDYVLIPPFKDEKHQYLNIVPGSRDVGFDLRAPTSIIMGACPALQPSEVVRITAVEVIDSFSVDAWMHADGSFSIGLPHGAYAVVAEVRRGDSRRYLTR
jgi:hypothetical protein